MSAQLAIVLSEVNSAFFMFDSVHWLLTRKRTTAYDNITEIAAISMIFD